MPLVQGTLVIADISGYTRYIAGTEQEHSVEILAELLSVMTRSFEGRLSIDQLEGDAICATTDRVDDEILGWLIATFGAFHRRLRDIRAATTCPCRACAAVGDLGLKFFAHRGTFTRQEIAGRLQLFGSDVNLVHRLTKNSVPLREYVYASAGTLEGWGEKAREGFVPSPQKYDIGDVEGSYLDLADARREALREPMTRVDARSARVRFDAVFDAPIDTVWRIWTDPALLQRVMGADRLDVAILGVRGTYVGGEFHCHHGEMTNVLRVVAVEPPREFTVACELPGIPQAYQTERLTQIDAAKTLYECFWGWPDPPGGAEATEAAVGLLRGMEPMVFGNFRGVIDDLMGRAPGAAATL